MISYIIQGVSVILLGPVLAMVVLAVEADREHWFILTTKPLARSIYQTNMILALSAVTASVVRFRQAAPVGEVEFLVLLDVFEDVISVVCVVSYLLVERSSLKKWITICTYGIATSAMYIASVLVRISPTTQSQVIANITTSCVAEHQYPAPVLNQPLNPRKQIAVYIVTIFGALSAFIYFGFTFGEQRIKRLFRKGYIIAALFIILGLAGLTASFTYLLNQMIYQRRELQKASSSTYQDNEWGFGQIIALMAWIPLALKLLLAIPGKVSSLLYTG